MKLSLLGEKLLRHFNQIKKIPLRNKQKKMIKSTFKIRIYKTKLKIILRLKSQKTVLSKI